MCTLGALVVLDAEDVFVEALEAGADGVHGVGVGAEVDEGGVVGEGEHGSSGVEADVAGPAGEVGGRLFAEVAVDGLVVELPLVPLAALAQIVEEDAAPLGTGNLVLELIGELGVGPTGVEVVQ